MAAVIVRNDRLLAKYDRNFKKDNVFSSFFSKATVIPLYFSNSFGLS